MSNYVEKEEQFEKTASRHQVLKVLSDDTIYPITVEDIFIENLDASTEKNHIDSSYPKIYVQFEVDDATGYIELKEKGIKQRNGGNILFESIDGVGVSSMYDVLGGTLKCNFEDTLESCTILPNEREVSVTFGDIDDEIPRLADCDPEMVDALWEQVCLKSSYQSVTTESDNVWEVDISWVTGVTDEKNAIEIHIEDEVGELIWEMEGPNSFSEDSLPAQFIEQVGQGAMEMLEGSTVCVIAEEYVPDGFKKGFTDRTGEWVLFSRQWISELEKYKEEQKKKKQEKKQSSSSRSRGASKRQMRKAKWFRNKGVQALFMSMFFVLMNNILLKPMIQSVTLSGAAETTAMVDMMNSVIELSVFLMICGAVVSIMYGMMLKSVAA